MVRVVINGFGRIGRMVFQASLTNNKIDVVAINDLTDPELLAHLLKYDSVQNSVVGKVKAGKKCIYVDGKKIPVYSERNPADLPWKDLKVDVVCESTGRFRTKEQAELHIKAGAKKVVISAPAKGPNVSTYVIGVNDDKIKKTDLILSNASCTTNSLAPLVKVLDGKFGIKKGFFTTTHAYTSTQNLVDGPSSDFRRARAAAVNMIPTTTGAAKALELVYPKMKGKLDGIAVRVPIPAGSLTDLTVEVSKSVTVEQVNAAFKEASKKMKDVLMYSEEPIVSSDIVGSAHSVIFDAPLTKVNGNMVKIFGWYDNEWGFSHRMIDLMSKL